MDMSVMKQLKQHPANVIPHLKLSEAIRRGIPHVEECSSYDGCALGAAWYGMFGKELDCNDRMRFMLTEGGFVGGIAGVMGYPVKLCEKISAAHFRLEMTREQCADYAEVHGW